MTSMEVNGCEPKTKSKSVDSTWTSQIIKLPQVSSRVGHGIIQYEGKVYLIGGGSEDGEVKEIWELEVDLNSDTVPTKLLAVPNFPGLYEFSSNRIGSRVWIFGGSDQENTKNSIYSFDLENHVWEEHLVHPEDKDNVPPPRTQFGNKCLVGKLCWKGMMYIFTNFTTLHSTKYFYIFTCQKIIKNTSEGHLNSTIFFMRQKESKVVTCCMQISKQYFLITVFLSKVNDKHSDFCRFSYSVMP